MSEDDGMEDGLGPEDEEAKVEFKRARSDRLAKKREAKEARHKAKRAQHVATQKLSDDAVAALAQAVANAKQAEEADAADAKIAAAASARALRGRTSARGPY